MSRPHGCVASAGHAATAVVWAVAAGRIAQFATTHGTNDMLGLWALALATLSAIAHALLSVANALDALIEGGGS